ncbi:MAG: hypothetical protein R8J84_06270 [Mariprofundales bacterium]
MHGRYLRWRRGDNGGDAPLVKCFCAMVAASQCGDSNASGDSLLSQTTTDVAATEDK